MLGRLIAHVGLEDAGELVALATTEQLTQIFDEDLWHSPDAGHDERFDSERFLVWLSILLEAGDRVVAERLAELPQELVTLAFHRHVLVLTEDALRAELTADDDEAEAAEKAFDSCLTEEIDEYQLIWRGGDGWDDVLSALLALDRDHHSLAVELLERCAALSREYIDDNGGLYEVLSSDEMLETDLAAEREGRRAERGYVAPSQAAAFLRLALARPSGEANALSARDPLTRAYFRELGRVPAAPSGPNAAPATQPGRLGQLLAASGIAAEAEPRLLPGARAEAGQAPLLIRALAQLADAAPALFSERSEELAYLSNVLVAGCAVGGRRLRPLEAVQYAIAAASLGLWLACGAPADEPPDVAEQLERHPCDVLLRLAFARARDPKLRVKPKNAAQDLERVRTLLKMMKV